MKNEIYKLLKNYLQNGINNFKKRYQLNDCHIFFSDEQSSKFFYMHSMQMLESFLTFDTRKIKDKAKNMGEETASAKIPYIVTSDTVISYKDLIIKQLIEDNEIEAIKIFYEIVTVAENCIANAYLNLELDKFLKFNKLRMDSIHRLADSNTLYLYEAHLYWLEKLIFSLKNMDTSKVPQLHPEKCIIGEWISTDAKEAINNKEVLNEFIKLHTNLHLIGKKIVLTFEQKPINFHMLMLLMKKAELLSLSIGVELAIINNAKFQANASKDPLTGALNRQLLFHIFSTQFELSKAIETGFCLIMMDLDGFKEINDNYGHIEGDKVLKATSSMLLSTLRESDFIIRYGGEEFLLILPSTELKNAIILAEKLKNSMHLLKKEYSLQTEVTASFGVLEIFANEGEMLDETLMSIYIDRVDKELYYAKNYGKDQVVSLNHPKRKLEI